MRHEIIRIPVAGDPAPLELVTYLPDNSEQIDPNRLRRTVIICPGGAYRFLSDRESEPVALQLTAAGFNVFVCRYHLPPDYRFPIPQLDLAAAVKYVRDNAEEFHCDKTKINVLGFSAGGHLALSLGVWYINEMFQTISENPEDIRPDGLILCYPVVTGGEFTHKESMKNLYNTTSKSFWEARSLENFVHTKMPPVFLWHTYEDASVPVENSLNLAVSLKECNVPLEMHIYPHGPHGQSLDTEEVFGPNAKERLCYPEMQHWIQDAIRWIRNA